MEVERNLVELVEVVCIDLEEDIDLVVDIVPDSADIRIGLVEEDIDHSADNYGPACLYLVVRLDSSHQLHHEWPWR